MSFTGSVHRRELEIGYGPGKWGDDDWSTVKAVSKETGEGKRLVIVQTVFAFLLLVGLLILSMVLFYLKRLRGNALKQMPLIATLVAMLFMIGCMTCSFAYNMVRLTVLETSQYYLICSLLPALFNPATYCTMFYVFYSIIHLFKDRMVKGTTRVSLAIKYVHWGIVGLFAALVIVDWSWFVAYMNNIVHDDLKFVKQSTTFEKIDSARCILFWLAAWEIVGWALYLGLLTSRNSSSLKIKMSVYFFMAACGFFLAVSFIFFVVDIISYLRSSTESNSTSAGDLAAGTEAIQEVLRFVFVQGSFLGLILCYWRFPEPELHSEKDLGEEVDVEKHGVINRTGPSPREVDGSHDVKRSIDLKSEIHEADYSREISEADGSDSTLYYKHGISEADGSKPILEADSKNVYEAGP